MTISSSEPASAAMHSSPAGGDAVREIAIEWTPEEPQAGEIEPKISAGVHWAAVTTPLLRFGLPAGVVIAGGLGASVIAGVFAGTPRTHAAAVHPSAAVTRPVQDTPLAPRGTRRRSLVR